MKQKTILASSIRELDEKCNLFASEQDVKASQMRPMVVNGILTYIETLWFTPKGTKDGLDVTYDTVKATPTAEVKPIWKQCVKCNAFVNTVRYQACKCGCTELKLPEKK